MALIGTVRRWWTGTPASAIQVSPMCRRSWCRRCSWPSLATARPRCRVSQYCGRDPAAAWSSEQPGVGAAVCRGDPLPYQFVNLGDQWYYAGAFAFGSLVDQIAGCCGLASDGPGPRGGVDVLHQAPGHLADTGGCARGEDDDVTPDRLVSGCLRYQGVGEVGQRRPVVSRAVPNRLDATQPQRARSTPGSSPGRRTSRSIEKSGEVARAFLPVNSVASPHWCWW